ncbi:MAG: ThiF family adenylyltransferase [Candidatus Omnitrophica bacterium]|nr:ThiF family adenylyltransferase [Candidatus Omnitrophota bacterium]
MWSESYHQMIDRNIGILTEAQQESLKGSTIALFGLGGLGGVIAEIFTRAGIGGLKIVDYDKFEPTNLNRQIFSFQDTLGRWKTDVTEEFLKKINPEIKIEKYNVIDQSNVDQILNNSKIAVLAIDSAKPCVIISRAAKRLGIPLVEGWAIPYGNSRVFMPDSPSLEEVYDMPTLGKDIADISDEDFKALKIYMLANLKKIDGVEKFYPPLAIERIQKGQIPSFAPIVWLTAVLMALETLRILLKWGEPILAPRFSLYNPFDNTIPRQEV